MKRREFIAALGGVAARPFARAQRSPIPVIGFLSSHTEQQAELAGVYAGDSGRVKPMAASAEKVLPCRDWRLALPAD